MPESIVMRPSSVAGDVLHELNWDEVSEYSQPVESGRGSTEI
jgi:hypothetical protein